MVGLKRFFLLIVLFVPLNSVAVISNVEGDGKFHSTDSDSLSFVKKQLIFDALKDIYTKELNSMGLDPNLFWIKFESKFKDYFFDIEESLKKRYGIDSDKVSRLQKENYQKALRQKRLALKARFGKLSRAMRSYSEKRVTRSTTSPKFRYLKIQAKVDRKIINKIYYQFTTEGKLREFSILYISASFNLLNAGWNDLGVRSSGQIIVPVMNHWKDWLEKVYSNRFKRVVVADESKIQTMKDYLKIPMGLKLEKAQEGDLENFNDSAWLHLSFNVSKAKEDKIMYTRSFEIDGSYLMTDLRDNSILGHFDFDPVPQVYSFRNEKGLSSNFASFVFSMPQEKLKKLTKTVSSVQVRNGVIDIKIGDIQSFEKMLLVTDVLATRGAAFGFRPKIHSFNGSDGVIEVTYRGSKEDVSKILLQIENRSIESRGHLVILDPKNPFSLKWVNTRSNKERRSGEG